MQATLKALIENNQMERATFPFFFFVFQIKEKRKHPNETRYEAQFTTKPCPFYSLYLAIK